MYKAFIIAGAIVLLLTSCASIPTVLVVPEEPGADQKAFLEGCRLAAGIQGTPIEDALWYCQKGWDRYKLEQSL